MLEPDGSSLIAHRDFAWNVGTPVLGAEEGWWNGSVSRRVRHGGAVTCATIGGGTIEVGADRLAAVPPPPQTR